MIRPSSHQKKLLKMIAERAVQLHRVSVGRAGRPTSYIYSVTSGTRGPTANTITALEDAGWIDWTHANTAVLTADGKGVL